MENKKVTAVEWLEDELSKLYYDTQFKTFEEFRSKEVILWEQAKAMEKEQTIDAYEYGYWRGNNDDDFEPEEYYKNPYYNPNNETYGRE